MLSDVAIDAPVVGAGSAASPISIDGVAPAALTDVVVDVPVVGMVGAASLTSIDGVASSASSSVIIDAPIAGTVGVASPTSICVGPSRPRRCALRSRRRTLPPGFLDSGKTDPGWGAPVSNLDGLPRS